MFATHLANGVYPERQDGKVDTDLEANTNHSLNYYDYSNNLSSHNEFIRPSLNPHHTNSDDQMDKKIKEKTSRTFKNSSTSSETGKFVALGSIKDALNKLRNSRHTKMLSELNLSAPEATGPVLYESKVSKWSSPAGGRFSNNYLVLTRKCLCHFKNSEKAVKIFDGIPLCTLPPKRKDNENLLDSSDGVREQITKTIPIENLILNLATVFAITEYLTPEPTVRLDYILSHKKQSFVTISALDLQKHRQWLISLRSAVRNSDSIGPYLNVYQRTWLIQKLMSEGGDLTDENEENLKAYRVLLKSTVDEASNESYEKERCLPVSLVIGKNNVYIIPNNLIIVDEKYRINKELSSKNPMFIEDIKLKQAEISKFKYPLLSLENIRSDGHDDTFQLTFLNNQKLTKRTLTLSSLLFEFIIKEIKSAIDSITYWYPNPSYRMQILSPSFSSLPSSPSLLSSSTLTPSTLSPSLSPSPLTTLCSTGRDKTQIIGLVRMIEAQCHAFRTSNARIAFNVEYVLGAESIILGLGVEHLPLRFTLLPPIENIDSNSYNSKIEGEESDYTIFELLAVFNSLKWHPLLYEVIFRDINLSKLNEISMLSTTIHELLVTNPKLRKLDLTSCRITEETVRAIGDALFTGKSSLERLIISDNHITKEGTRALARGITAHESTIKELDVSNCGLTDESLELILNALDTDNIEKLESLNLSNNKAFELDNILSGLLSRTVNLRSLNLRNCNQFFTKVKKCIPLENLNLTTLDIGGIPLNGKEQLRSLYSYIQSTSFTKIKYFSVDHCNLDGEALAIILSYITSSPNYEKIRVWAGGNYVTRTSVGCKELCNAIRNDWTPVWLSLDNTIFGSNADIVEDILTAFCENSVLKFLDLSHPQFRNDNEDNDNEIFKFNPITARKGCEAIGKIFRENKSIKELILLGNAEQRWGQSLGIQLMELENNKVLERLNIKGNGISNFGAKCLSEALKSNATLKLLNMDENEIGIEGYLDFHNLITTHGNTTLQELVYPVNDMQIFFESLDAKLSSPTSRDILFSSQLIRSNRILIEKQKVEFKNIIGKITLTMEEHLKINSENTEEINIIDEKEEKEEIEDGYSENGYNSPLSPPSPLSPLTPLTPLF